MTSRIRRLSNLLIPSLIALCSVLTSGCGTRAAQPAISAKQVSASQPASAKVTVFTNELKAVDTFDGVKVRGAATFDVGSDQH